MVRLPAYRIGFVVIGHVGHNKQVISTDRILDKAFGFTGTKARSACIYNIGVTFKTLESNRCFVVRLVFVAPLHKILVDFFSEGGTV